MSQRNLMRIFDAAYVCLFVANLVFLIVGLLAPLDRPFVAMSSFAAGVMLMGCWEWVWSGASSR